MATKSKKALRQRKARNVITGLARSGMAVYDVNRLSPGSAEAVLAGERYNRKLGQNAATRMADTSGVKPKAAPKKRKKGY